MTGRARARTGASDEDVRARLAGIVGAENLLVDPERCEPYAQYAVKEKFPPEAVVLPRDGEEVSQILLLANERRFPVTRAAAASATRAARCR